MQARKLNVLESRESGTNATVAENKPEKRKKAERGKHVGVSAQLTEVERVILRRRSTRKYKKQQVPEHMIRRMLEAARFAPSAGNFQPWRFIVIQRQELIAEMEKLVLDAMAPLNFLKTAPAHGIAHKLLLTALGLFRMNTGELRPIGGITEILKGRLRVFHDAPTVILVLKDRRGVSHPEFDTALASHNMVLTAHAMGLGTCYVGFVELLKYNSGFMRRLGIEYPWEIQIAVTVGFPRFDSDGEVQRDTPQIDWYDDTHPEGKVVY